MRTTVTIDGDVERMLRDAMHESRRSFKETLNAALRAGLSGRPTRARTRPFKVKARNLGLRPGVDPLSLNRLADDLETDAVAAVRRPMNRQTGRARRRAGRDRS
jgi:hypothetical protein